MPKSPLDLFFEAVMYGECIGNLVSPEEINLQDIIKERKSLRIERKLKAMEKRQVDLQRIAGLKSASGIDPLEQFPKEIWEEIFNALDPKDRGNARQVHPLFSHLLEVSEIGDILLPQVLQLNEFHRKFEPPSEFYSADYEFTKQLRCISRLTRDYFDRWIDINLEKRLQEPDAFYKAYHNHISIDFSKNSDHRLLARLLSAFGEGENPAKRFFPRGFSVFLIEQQIDFQIQAQEPEPEGDDQGQGQDRQGLGIIELRRTFRTNIKASLSLIGAQIWHFRFFIADEERTPSSFAEIYTLFVELISLLPNLKWLEFSVEGVDQVLQKGNNNSEFLRDHPFPHVASLERITLHCDIHPPNPYSCQVEILTAVIAANPQIRILDVVDGEDGEINELPAHQIKQLTNLNSITLAHHNSLGLCLLYVVPIFNYNWPLKSIYLDLNMEETVMISLFRFLNKFPTLENLNLSQLWNPSIGDTDKWGYLELPKLTDINLSVECPAIDYDSNIHFFFSLQFLLHCEKLKTIKWKMFEFDETKLRRHLKEYEKSGNIIDFRAGLRILYESNLWDVFPNLEYCRSSVRKSGYESDNVHLKFANFCSHEYLRPVQGQRVSIAQFLKSHNCCRIEHGLHSCVLFAE